MSRCNRSANCTSGCERTRSPNVRRTTRSKPLGGRQLAFDFRGGDVGLLSPFGFAAHRTGAVSTSDCVSEVTGDVAGGASARRIGRTRAVGNTSDSGSLSLTVGGGGAGTGSSFLAAGGVGGGSTFAAGGSATGVVLAGSFFDGFASASFRR